MNNKLECGMVFKSFVEVYDYLQFTHLRRHSELTQKKLNNYCNWHKEGMKIIIDNVFDKVLEYKTSNYKYKYNIGDIIDTKSGKIKIINQKRIMKKQFGRKAYDCLCFKCKQEFDQYEFELNSGTGCPVCGGKRIVIGINDMWTTEPGKAKFLANPEDGYTHMKCSNEKIDCRCDKCGSIIKNVCINDINPDRFNCPSCSDGISYPEKFIYNLFKSININAIRQLSKTKVKWIKTGIKYDFAFYINSELCICETNGNQHYEECSLTTRTLQEEQENDKFKWQLAKSNNIKHYIMLDCRKSELEWIKKSVMESELPILLNFTEEDIDWDDVHMKSMSSLKIMACELWNSGIHDREILSEIVGVSCSKVMLYIKDCNKMGLCNYEDVNTFKIGNDKRVLKEYQKNGNPFVCIETGHVFGKASTLVRISEKLYGIKLYSSGVINTLKGLQPNTKGFTFKYITMQEFNKAKQTLSSDQVFGDLFILPESNLEDTKCINT